jgi:hypothetical protein
MLRSVYKGWTARSAVNAAMKRNMSKMPENVLEMDQAQKSHAITDRSAFV